MIKKGKNEKVEKKKNLPVGIDNFEVMIQNNYYYFDKTGLIEEILESGTTRILFTRPRRFGKSLNMSMLKYFFDVKNKDENKKLFENLEISKSEYFDRQGQNPVIFISFKDFEDSDWKKGYNSIKWTISDVYNQFKFLRENLDERDLVEFDKVWFKEDYDYTRALLDLSRYLYEYYGKKIVLLIDEYDKPLIATLENQELQEQYRATLKAFYSVIKSSNDYIHLSFLTGVTKFSKVSIFSDLNNLFDISFDEEYSSLCGITEEELLSNFMPEVQEMANEYNESYDNMLAILRRKYDGYRFGRNEERIYNPFSLFNVKAKTDNAIYNFEFKVGGKPPPMP